NNPEKAKLFAAKNPDLQIRSGLEGLNQAASMPEGDIVISAIVGAAGLIPTFTAAKAGKHIGLANKESLVMAGRLLRQHMGKNQELLPVDSEHSAIFQCLQGENVKDIKKIILTASGGPFREKTMEELSKVTKEEALKHPSWDMGAKITIDSATLMNKGLEVIEAKWLFNLRPEQIDVVVHPESIIHSMVEFVDGSVIAQLSVPDMRLPIAYALSFPERIPLQHKELNLAEIGSLNFYKPDMERFPCLRLAIEAMKGKGSCSIVLNAANEIAVDALLKDKITFNDIPRIIEKTLSQHKEKEVSDLNEVLEMDAWARKKAEKELKLKKIN
ncbi:MAG: 1-deoxy-D-xylulose-5-phosphate reductoisomerase, partial [Nitrospinae bacterium]|nr:1-deoxy-D-xylulose-5-phosphate reductoisomerase [Nitrospinota bacterium]